MLRKANQQKSVAFYAQEDLFPKFKVDIFRKSKRISKEPPKQ
jgi:hypothetical protein